MHGAHTASGSDAGARVHALGARIHELLEQVQRTGAQAMTELRARIEAELARWDNAALSQALAHMHSAASSLSFAQLRQGWLARLRGRHHVAHAKFIAAQDRMIERASVLKSRAADLAGVDPECGAGLRRMLAELAALRDALDAEIDQAVNALQEMCTQLGEARTRGERDPQLLTHAESAQRFTRELKGLQALSSMAHEIVVRGKSVALRRCALMEQVRGELEHFEQHCVPRLNAMVADLRAQRRVADAIPEAIEAHDAFMKRLTASVDACGALQLEEELVLQHLAMLQDARAG